MKITSVYRQDKIGSLSEAGGTMTLAPSILTIGGKQYDTEASLNVSWGGSAQATLYMIYAVVSGGTVQLVTSTNYNSVGPAGYNAWKLVGAYSIGYDIVADAPKFWEFVPIDGERDTVLNFTAHRRTADNQVKSDLVNFRADTTQNLSSTVNLPIHPTERIKLYIPRPCYIRFQGMVGCEWTSGTAALQSQLKNETTNTVYAKENYSTWTAAPTPTDYNKQKMISVDVGQRPELDAKMAPGLIEFSMQHRVAAGPTNIFFNSGGKGDGYWGSFFCYQAKWSDVPLKDL